MNLQAFDGRTFARPTTTGEAQKRTLTLNMQFNEIIIIKHLTIFRHVNQPTFSGHLKRQKIKL